MSGKHFDFQVRKWTQLASGEAQAAMLGQNDHLRSLWNQVDAKLRRWIECVTVRLNYSPPYILHSCTEHVERFGGAVVGVRSVAERAAGNDRERGGGMSRITRHSTANLLRNQLL